MKVVSLALFCAALRFSESAAQEDESWLLESPCAKPTVYLKHRNVPVCLLTNVGTKAVFYPKVDEYSVIDVPAIHANYKKDDPYYSRWLTGPNSTSEIRLSLKVGDKTTGTWTNNRKTYVPNYKTFNRNSSAIKYVVPFFTAIAVLNKGELHSIVWDDGCYTCDAADCLNNRDCGVQLNEDNQCPEDTLCQARVYVAWVGTDGNEEPLTSAGSVISRFRAFSLKGVVEQTEKGINKLEEVAS